jgi:hypothetical protein
VNNEQSPKTQAKLRFSSRLAPKSTEETIEEADRGIPVVSELNTRLPVIVAAGRTYSQY